MRDRRAGPPWIGPTRGRLGDAALALVLVSSCAALAGCGKDRPRPALREPARVDRPAIDPRRTTIYKDASLVRLDDRYDSLEWQGGDPDASGPKGRAWEFDGSNEGWTFEGGARPEAKNGRLFFESDLDRHRAVVSPPDLGVRFRSIRAIEIRMTVSAGRHMTLFWSPDERFVDRLSVTADLRPGPEPRVYTVKASSLGGYEGLTLNRLRLVPTDSERAEVAIDSVRLVPREGLYSGLGHGLGREEIANESRHVIYARAPASFSAQIMVPPGGLLDVGVGVLDADPGVTFSATVEDGGPRQTVISEEVTQDETWEDVTADLSHWSGRRVRITLTAQSSRSGSVALWSNPTIHPGGARPEGPNVIVYLIDTLRADHVGCYGSKNATTPTIDRLARIGVLFERCTSQASWTRPSVASILTSLYPPDHGVVDQGFAVSDGVITMAEEFRRAGYLTAGFSTSTHAGSSANLARGYDQFLEPPAITGDARLTVEGKRKDYSKKNAEAINRRLLPWLRSHADRKMFLYLHAMDPHAPYMPPPPYDRIFDAGYRGTIDGSYDPVTGFLAAKTPADWEHVKSLYDGDIRDNDDRLGEIVAELERLGLLEDTILVVSADHGEEFREHGGVEHGQSLFDELLHVPLVIAWPRGLRSDAARGGEKHDAVRITHPVESIDILPTLCRLAGVPPPPDARGVSRASLMPLESRVVLAGGTAPEEGPAASYSWRLGPKGEEVSVSQSGFKLIWRPAAGNLLFDLSKDPGEQHDLSRSLSERTAALSGLVDRWWSQRRRIVSSSDRSGVTIDAEEHRWLEALGYVK